MYIVDGSTGFPRVRAGHRQAFKQEKQRCEGAGVLFWSFWE